MVNIDVLTSLLDEEVLLELTGLLDGRVVNQATANWASVETSASALKEGKVVRCSSALSVIAHAASAEVRGVAARHRITQEDATAKLLWGLLVTTSTNYGDPAFDVTGSGPVPRPRLAAFLLLGLGNSRFFPRWAPLPDAAITRERRADTWPVFGQIYEDITRPLSTSAKASLATWNSRNPGMRRTLAAVAYGPPYPPDPPSYLAPNRGNGLKGVARDLAQCLASDVESGQVLEAVLAALGVPPAEPADRIAARRARVLLACSIIFTALFTALFFREFGRSADPEAHYRSGDRARVVADTSTYTATATEVRNETLTRSNAGTMVAADLGDKIKFDIDFVNSARRHDDYSFFRLRQTVADNDLDTEDREEWFAAFMVDPAGNEHLVKGSQFALKIGGDCSTQSRVGISDVLYREQGYNDSVVGLGLSGTDFAPDPAYLVGSRAIFTSLVVEPSQGTPMSVSGVLQLEPTIDSGGLLDGTDIRFSRANGSPEERITTARIGDDVRISVHLHRGGCGFGDITPFLQFREKASDGYLELSATSTTIGEPQTFAQGRLSVIGTRRATLVEVPGTAKFWTNTCKGPVVASDLDFGVLSGGVGVGAVPEFVPRDKCETHLKYVTVEARVVGK